MAVGTCDIPFAGERSMSVAHTHESLEERAPLSVSVLVIGGLSALSWAMLIGIIMGIWTLL